MAISKNEIQKKMLIKQTINSMNKQIAKLEEQKKKYIESGKEAKQKGLTSQYNLALAGLRMCLTQQKRVYEMKLNFEITSQMKDITKMTSEFLKGMQVLSKDMCKISKERDFLKVQKQFAEAMTGVELQTEQMEGFMDETESSFSSAYSGSEADNKELDALIGNEAASDDITSSMIDKELEEIKKKMM